MDDFFADQMLAANDGVHDCGVHGDGVHDDGVHGDDQDDFHDDDHDNGVHDVCCLFLLLNVFLKLKTYMNHMTALLVRSSSIRPP